MEPGPISPSSRKRSFPAISSESENSLPNVQARPDTESHGLTSDTSQGTNLLRRTVLQVAAKKPKTHETTSFAQELHGITLNANDISGTIDGLAHIYTQPTDYKNKFIPNDFGSKILNWFLQKIGMRENDEVIIQHALRATASDLGQYLAQQGFGLDDFSVMSFDTLPGVENSLLYKVFLDAYIKEWSTSCISHIDNLAKKPSNWADRTDPQVTAPKWMFNKLGIAGWNSEAITESLIPRLLSGDTGKSILATNYFNGLITSNSLEAEAGIAKFYNYFGGNNFEMPSKLDPVILRAMIDLKAIRGVDEASNARPSLYHAHPHFVQGMTRYLLDYLAAHPEDPENNTYLRDFAQAYRGFSPNTTEGQAIAVTLRSFIQQLDDDQKAVFNQNFPPHII